MRALLLLTAAILVPSAGAISAHAEMTPVQFLQRFIGEANAALNPPARPKKKPAVSPRALVPLEEIPMPVLSPREPADGALGYSADPTPVLAPTPPAKSLIVLPEAIPVPQAAAVPETAPVSHASPVPEATVASLPEKPAEPTPALKRPPPAAISLCGVALADLGVVATPLAPITDDQCGVPAPVAVSALDDGAIKLSTKAIVDCHLAERLAGFVKKTIEPLAEKAGGKLTGLRIAASYACRTRDSIPDAKLSEHAFGDAIDISAFRLGDRWIDVKEGWATDGADKEFLASVRQSACGPFATVLGPGSDGFHTDHFHLDMIERRTAGPSKGLYCK